MSAAENVLVLSKPQLVRDFYNSYFFSQGASEAQQELYRGLKQYYESHNMDYQQSLHAEDIEQRVLALKLPGRHDQEILNAGGDGFWTEFSGFKAAMGPPRYYAPSHKFGGNGLINSLIHKDLKYQARPRHLSSEDVHRSYFRQYVVLGDSTRQPSYDSIFDKAHSVYSELSTTELSMTTEIDLLVEAWESNHRGQKFFGAK